MLCSLEFSNELLVCYGKLADSVKKVYTVNYPIGYKQYCSIASNVAYYSSGSLTTIHVPYDCTLNGFTVYSFPNLTLTYIVIGF